MGDKFWKFIGYWAVSLLMFIVTLVVIRWTIDFVTWSTLDSGWAQVIGAILALMVAIYVMSRQNKHATRLIVDADTLALRRRSSAVNAIVKRIHHVVRLAYELGSEPRGSIDNVSHMQRRLKGSQRSVELMLAKVKEIPAHELGSFDIVDSLFVMQGTLVHLERLMGRIIDDPRQIGLPDTVHSFFRILDRIEEAHQQFADGAREFRNDRV